MQTQSSTDSDLTVPVLPDVLPPGAKAGPWTIEKEIGRGGMGSVYAVVHDGIGKRAALKLIHRRLLQPQHIERMLIEARVVNRVGHPNIVDIFETGTLADGRPYIVMERLDGVSLSNRVLDGHIMPVEVIAILLQVCDALIAAHDCSVIHRDLKTDNVFLCKSDDGSLRVKLLDWGIAKELEVDVRHTSEGHVVGTPQYLAPEQARAGKVSDRTDVYSLGVMAYELLLEQLPFEAETPLEVMTMHLRAVPPPPRELWPEIPLPLEALLLSMLAKDPAARPSARAVAQQLEAVRDALEARRGAGVVLPPRTSARLPRAATPVELAPTPTAGGSATWAPVAPSRRWQFAIGAVALALSAALFFITRASDSAASATSSAAATAAATGLPVEGDPVTPSPLHATPVAGAPPVALAPVPVPPPVVVPLDLAPPGVAPPGVLASGHRPARLLAAPPAIAKPRAAVITPQGGHAGALSPNGTMAAY